MNVKDRWIKEIGDVWLVGWIDRLADEWVH